jgi:hypothetical protein
MVAATASPRRGDEGLRGLIVGPGGGAMLAGLTEIIIFHPFDTVSKRLQSHQQRVLSPRINVLFRNVRNVVLPGIPPEAPLKAKLAQLYPGSKWAVLYKVSQRTMKFAGQPYMKDYLEDGSVGQGLRRTLGNATGKMALEATAGCIVGVSEVILLPLDRMKVLSQTNKQAIGNRSVVSIVRQEGIQSMYAGLCTTASRNALGTFLLFGGTAWTKHSFFQLKDFRTATFSENVASSAVGACLGVLCTSPQDVIKTRIQNKNFGQKTSGMEVFFHVIRTEGPSAFFKGIVPKVITTAPRLVLAFTLTEYFTQLLRSGNEPPRIPPAPLQKRSAPGAAQ